MNLKISRFESAGLYPPAKKGDDWLIHLAIRMINQAFMDLQLKNPSGGDAKEWQRDAYEWFLSEETAPGSLVWWCKILETDPALIRQKVFGGTERKAS
jgi:hypothetical protein